MKPKNNEETKELETCSENFLVPHPKIQLKKNVFARIKNDHY
jgi:hypothetical protein